MKLSTKILTTLLGICLSLIFILYLYLVLAGKAVLNDQLQHWTKHKVTIGSFSVMPPLNIVIKDLDIEGKCKAQYISISPSLLSLMRGTLGFNEVKIIKPEVIYEKFPVPKLTQIADAAAAAQIPNVTPLKAQIEAEENPFDNFRLHFIIKRLIIRDGSLDYFDHTVGNEGIRIFIKGFNFNLSNLYVLPRSAVANFELIGYIPWRESKEEGKISADGWLDLYKRDMRATLKITGIDGVYLYPFYSQWVDLQKARIEKAKLNFLSNINSLDNDVIAQCHLELTDIVFKERSPEKQQQRAELVAHKVLDILKSMDQGRIILDFTYKTRMDKPEFGLGVLRGAIEEKFIGRKNTATPIVGSIFVLPLRLMEGTVKAGADLSKAVIDGSFAVGNEFKKAVEGSFKK